MKVMVLGLRALPGVAGGVESHCEHLYPIVAASGVDVEILVRSAHADPESDQSWRGMRIRRLWSPRKSGIEAIVHTFLGVMYAAVRRPDVLHLHSIGPAIFTPLARLLGLHVVVTHHAFDYAQAKWGWLGKRILRAGERMAMRYANEVISVSRHGAAELKRLYGREPVLISNGVPIIEWRGPHPILGELGLETGRYVLHVGRAIPDKRHDDLIHAFGHANLNGWKLVLVGDLSGDDEYSVKIRRMAAERSDILLAGFRSGVELQAIFSNAGCFALPSTVEGLPIALLEALSAGCVVIGSDIPANHEIELPAACYFEVGDVKAMAAALSTISATVPRRVWQALRARVHAEYDWRHIADQTIHLYRDSLQRARDRRTGEARKAPRATGAPRIRDEVASRNGQ